MKTITITNNIPTELVIEKLDAEIKTAFPGSITCHQQKIFWQDNTVTEETITIHDLDDSVTEQDIILILSAHKPYGLLGKIHVCEPSCTCDESHLYRTLRRKLINYTIANSSIMTPEQLKEAASNFAVPVEVRNMFLSADEQVKLGEIFNFLACQDRQCRIDRITSFLMNYLTYAQVLELAVDIKNYGDLVSQYILYGSEGTTEGDPPALFDYIESTPGTPYENTGVASKNFIPQHEITLAQLIQKVMGVLRIAI